MSAVIFAIPVEYYMIVPSSFPNFQSVFGLFGGATVYLAITGVTMAFVRLSFKRINTSRFFITWIFAVMIIIPIGYYWSVTHMHDPNNVLDPYWEFTSDFVYIMLVSQFIVTSILLLGTYDVRDELEKIPANVYEPEETLEDEEEWIGNNDISEGDGFGF